MIKPVGSDNSDIFDILNLQPSDAVDAVNIKDSPMSVLTSIESALKIVEHTRTLANLLPPTVEALKKASDSLKEALRVWTSDHNGFTKEKVTGQLKQALTDLQGVGNSDKVRLRRKLPEIEGFIQQGIEKIGFEQKPPTLSKPRSTRSAFRHLKRALKSGDETEVLKAFPFQEINKANTAIEEIKKISNVGQPRIKIMDDVSLLIGKATSQYIVHKNNDKARELLREAFTETQKVDPKRSETILASKLIDLTDALRKAMNFA